MRLKCLVLQKFVNQINLSDRKEVYKCICYSGSAENTNFLQGDIMQITKKNMIESQLKPEGISCLNTIDCISRVNREDFTPIEFMNLAYAEYDIPLNSDYSMLKPLIVAKILQLLEITKSDVVLEIGTGSGYLTSCLSLMGKFVDTVDIDPLMLEKSKIAHKNNNITNIHYAHEDIFSNWSPKKNYDVIVVNGSIESRIKKLEDVLRVNGRMFAVIGQYPVMHASLIERVSENKLLSNQVFETLLDPLKNINKKKCLNF